ncbi:unnamed protein product [Larinioides sclopetarius]|uniref:FZ domain-containing protein n=1 Tax=Larinioides sclopetarius TaxID=280406 RepID=A0AAV2ANE8_9ARAC
MRFEHGSHRTECLAALIVLLLLLCCCCCSAEVPPPFGTFRQCLHLDEDVGPWEACGAQGRSVRLRFCDAYEPARLMRVCTDEALNRLRESDGRAREAACRFRRLLDRYDCENANSVWTCKDCEEAYKQWVCAMYLPPLQVEDEGVKPCRYICRLVEQRCPYFHPSVKDQYAGERVFKCIDPDIPDLDSIQDMSSYGPPHRCYCPQHLGSEVDSGEEECRLLTPAQLRRTASRRGQHRSGVGPGRPALATLLLTAAVAWWTRTR